jgi:hypothetical protein
VKCIGGRFALAGFPEAVLCSQLDNGLGVKRLIWAGLENNLGGIEQ